MAACASVSHNKKEAASSLTNSNETTFKWTVEYFSFTPKGISDKLCSPVFANKNNANIQWQIEFYPNGYVNTKYIVLFLTLVECKLEAVNASFDFSLLNEKGAPVKIVSYKNKTFSKGTSQGLRILVTRDYLNKNIKTPDNKLTIFCKVKTSFTNQTAVAIMSKKNGVTQLSNTSNKPIQRDLKEKSKWLHHCDDEFNESMKEHNADLAEMLLEADETIQRDLEEQAELLQSCDDEFNESMKEHNADLAEMLLEADETIQRDLEEQADFLQSCDDEFNESMKEHNADVAEMLLEADETIQRDLEEQADFLQSCDDEFNEALQNDLYDYGLYDDDLYDYDLHGYYSYEDYHYF